MSEPYLSFLFAARNDDYSKNFMSRFQITLDCLQYFANKHKVSYEIIIVEWSPLGGKRLVDALSFKYHDGPVRIITVPEEYNMKISSSPFDVIDLGEINFYEYLAKNVGIRRAKGEYLLCTNADIILHESLMDIFGRKQLSKEYFYRAYRYDIKHKFPLYLEMDNPWAFFKKFSKMKGKKNKDGSLQRKAAGDFFLMHRDHYEVVKGYPEIRCDGLMLDDFIMDCSATFMRQFLFDDPQRIYHQNHAKRWKTYDKDNHTILGNEKVRVRYEAIKDEMAEKKIILSPNGDDWGFNSIDFEETIING